MITHRAISRGVLALGFLGLCLPAAYAQDLRVKSWKIIRGQASNGGQGQGGRLDWSPKGKLIAYDKIGSDGFYDLWTMNVDGSNDNCLTCSSTTTVSKYNVGSPRWSPDGNWILLVVQRAELKDNRNGRPGVGADCDVWVMDYVHNKYYKLADTSTYQDGGGVLHPVFSHQGDKVFWVERIAQPAEHPSGDWAMRLADFQVDASGVPSLANVRTLTPPNSNAWYYESHDFSLDDTKVTFTANTDGQQAPQGGDVIIMDIATMEWTNLTDSPALWDEHLHPIPGTGKYIWMTENQTFGTGPGALRTEFWMMDGDGSNKHKLTWFNDNRSQSWDQFGGGVTADLSFGPPGATGVPDQVMAYVILDGSGLGNTGINILLDLEPSSTSLNAASFFRPPLSADSFISVFSSTASLATTSAVGHIPYPPTLGGTSVSVTDAQGTSRPAPLVYVGPLTSTTPSQINMIVPTGTAPGPADIAITNSDGVVMHETYTIEAASPAVFAANYQGSGPAAAYIQRSDIQPGDPSAFTFTSQDGRITNTPINVGGVDTYLSLFGTGIRGAKSVTVQVGTTNVPVLYAGAQSEFPALDQVVVKLPSSLGGQNQEYNVTLFADGVAANTVTIRIR